MRSSTETDVFFALLRAGLWEQGVRLAPYGTIDFAAVFQLAEEQSAIGLVAAGLEHVEDMKVAKQDVLPFMKRVLVLEDRNAKMNRFIGSLVTDLRSAGIQPVLVKGQGIAQCYARPHWRAAGDVDLLLDKSDYERAKAFLSPKATAVEKELEYRMHWAGTIDSWPVELHGSLRNRFLGRMNRFIDSFQQDAFANQRFRIWMDGDTEVLLPVCDDDAVFIFYHILQHFFAGGIGLRQICDWCRLLWTYRDVLDVNLLEQRITGMGILTEWKAFASFAVEYLGMPPTAMPLFTDSKRWMRKAGRIGSFILRVGNFGHNRDMSYYVKYPFLIRKIISLGRRLADMANHCRIFPLDSLRFSSRILFSGLRSAARGE